MLILSCGSYESVRIKSTKKEEVRSEKDQGCSVIRLRRYDGPGRIYVVCFSSRRDGSREQHDHFKRSSKKIVQPEGKTPARLVSSCRQAIMDTWPKGLWQKAFITLDHENGHENPLATNHNTNGSTDIGCLQTNTIHLGKYGWNSADQAYNATFNAKLAYQIYLHGGWHNWFSVRGILW